MNQVYLMAQLPSLDALSDTAPLPITEERFEELCERFLGRRILSSLRDLTLIPARDGQDPSPKFVREWNCEERRLRLALAQIRAEKLHISPPSPTEPIPTSLLQAARAAVEMDDPMEAERYLTDLRLQFLDNLRPADPFSEDAVYYYGMKLKLISRLRGFDESRGRAAYRNIYDSILRGDEQEAKA